MITCKNCGHSFEGKYCSNCRQAANTERITWHYLLHHIPHALFHIDRGLFYTAKELALRPGNTLREYLNGKREYHFNPFVYLFLIGGFTSLFYVSFHIQPPNLEINLSKIEAFSNTIAYKYFAFVGLLFITLLTITDYFFYYKKKYSIPELIVVNTFQVGQVMVFTLIIIPLFLLQEFIAHKTQVHFELRFPFKILVIAFLFYTRVQFYEARKEKIIFVKILVQLGLIYFIYNFLVARLIVKLLD